MEGTTSLTQQPISQAARLPLLCENYYGVPTTSYIAISHMQIRTGGTGENRYFAHGATFRTMYGVAVQLLHFGESIVRPQPSALQCGPLMREPSGN